MKVISEKLLGGTMYAPFCRTLDPKQEDWDKDFENMAKMGYTENVLRSPLYPMEEENERKLIEAMQRAGVAF